jgi:hypothetical protein
LRATATDSNKASINAFAPGSTARLDTRSPLKGVKAVENSETRAEQARALTSTLKNMTYTLSTGEAIEVVKLVNGKAKVDGNMFYLNTGSVASGDLDGDGRLDAVTVIGWTGGGSGFFESLVGITDVNGKRVTSAQQVLGDRIVVRALSIKNREVTVALTTQAPNDGMCCPTQRKTLRFVLQGNSFVETPP